MAEWQGIVKLTTPQYLKGAQNLTLRGRLLLKKLEQAGRIKFNSGGGYKLVWDVRKREHDLEAYGDATSLVFSRLDAYDQLEVDWRGYKSTDLMTEKERLMNDGDQAIVKRYSVIAENMAADMRNNFSKELFVDGYANPLRLHGLESFCGVGTCGAGDRIAQPNDSYGGKSTALGGITGSWSSTLSTKPNSTVATDWPDGSGDADYDFLSPKLVNWSSTGWGTGSTSWESNCERVLRQTTIWLTRGGGQDARPTMYLLSGDLFYPYLNKQESKQRIIVPHKEAQDLGFGDVVNQEGVMIQHDFDVPSRTGYGLNVNQMEVRCLGDSLFQNRGPEYSIQHDAYLFVIGMFGNCTYQPKYFAKFYSYA